MRAVRDLLDAGVIVVALVAAYLLRFDGALPARAVEQLPLLTAMAVTLKLGLLHVTRVSRHSWRYFSLREVTELCGGVLLAALGLLAARAIGGGSLFLPYGVVGTDLALSIVGLCSLRGVRRLTAQVGRQTGAGNRQRRIVLVGADDTGFQVSREITQASELGMRVVAFVDDRRELIGTRINGIEVRGPLDDLEAIVQATRADELLITVAHASGSRMREILQRCETTGLPTKIIPAIHEIVGGRVSLSSIRPVQVEDLLGRDPVELDLEGIETLVRRRTVLVTGAGGSIGSELCRQLVRFEPLRLVLVERAETALFQIERELGATVGGTVEIVPALADVTDEGRMRSVFDRYRPDVVFHAAAHKHVPMVERNPGEAIKNNIGGTRTVADLAHQRGVDVFVNVSTDKAVNPTSVMGTTKRAAELYVQALDDRSATRFVSVRFGNVLGSSGSVLTVFREQLEAGGPLTVTDPEMTRYFMTIPEACQLVLQAGAMGIGGEVFVLDMGEPVRIVDLAAELIRLSGLRPGDDVEIVFTGRRPGEKLYEELQLDSERTERTRHPKILIGHVERRPYDDVQLQLDLLLSMADEPDAGQVHRQLHRVVPEFVSPDTVLGLAEPSVG